MAIHESDIDVMRRRVEGIARRHLHEHIRGIELHAQKIRAGSGPWGRIPANSKRGLLTDIPRLLGSFVAAQGREYALFAVARAPDAVPGVDPLERTFEELLLRFKQFLVRMGPDELGIVVADKSKYEPILQPMVRVWHQTGTRVGSLKRLVETPMFVDSSATRMVQLADFVAHAVYRRYTVQDESLFAPLLPMFDRRDGVIHGLVHLVRNYRYCPCPACVSRATANRL